MFTGIIREFGKIVDVKAEKDASTLTIELKQAGIGEGDSIAINGACLTVLEENAQGTIFRLMKETLDKTNLDQLVDGDVVNTEQAMAAGDNFDGHFVQGHVDGTAEIVEIEELPSGDKIFYFKTDKNIVKYLTPKGSVALEGVSLTVVDVDGDQFTTSIMPYSLEKTTFGKMKLGDVVNIEADILAKQVVTTLERINK